MNKSLTPNCDALNHAIMEIRMSKTEKYLKYERLLRPMLNTLSDVSSSGRITAIQFDMLFDLSESIRVDFPNDVLLQRVRIAIRTFLDFVCESVEFELDSIRFDVYLWALKIALELG